MSDDASSEHDTVPWSPSEPEPTNIIALWPDREPPTLTEIVAAISSDAVRGLGSGRTSPFASGTVKDSCGVDVDEGLETESPDVAWCAAVRMPELPSPFIIWSQPAHPIPPDELPGVDVTQCAWIVGFETILEADFAFEHYATLVAVIARALPESPALLDVNTTRWFPREELNELFLDDEIEPPAEVLWVVQAVMSESEDEAEAWLHTHGLRRCGAPELEMLEVPNQFIEAAAELVNDVAALVLEQTPPSPGEPLEIGTGLRIVLQPWEDIVCNMPNDAPGGAVDRTGEFEGDEDGPHTGVRAVICAAEPAGSFKRTWVWPREVTERLMRDEAGVYMTTRATERQARLARAGWDQLATAFASTGCLRNGALSDDEPGVVFGVKAGFAADDDASSREHIWFRVHQFEAERVEGELLNQPFSLRKLNKGDRVWIERTEVSDWRVMTPEGCFGPNLVASMWRAIDRLKEEAQP